jgi:hypothetical protein
LRARSGPRRRPVERLRPPLTGTPDGFVNAGVHVEEGNYDSATATNFLLTGFKYASRDTTIQAECNATAATFAAGPISCRIDYMIVKF